MPQHPAASLGPSWVVPLPSFSGLGPAAQTQGYGALLGGSQPRQPQLTEEQQAVLWASHPPDVKTRLIVLEPKGPFAVSQPNSHLTEGGPETQK